MKRILMVAIFLLSFFAAVCADSTGIKLIIDGKEVADATIEITTTLTPVPIPVPIPDPTPVPTTKWTDVTKDIEIREDRYRKDGFDPGGVFHAGERLANLICGGRYRVRKMDDGCTWVSRLIVEKKECC